MSADDATLAAITAVGVDSCAMVIWRVRIWRFSGGRERIEIERREICYLLMDLPWFYQGTMYIAASLEDFDLDDENFPEVFQDALFEGKVECNIIQ